MNRITTILCSVFIVASSAGRLLGQIPDKPGHPPPVEGLARYVPLLFGAILVAGVCLAAFKNAKRTHLD